MSTPSDSILSWSRWYIYTRGVPTAPILTNPHPPCDRHAVFVSMTHQNIMSHKEYVAEVISQNFKCCGWKLEITSTCVSLWMLRILSKHQAINKTPVEWPEGSVPGGVLCGCQMSVIEDTVTCQHLNKLLGWLLRKSFQWGGHWPRWGWVKGGGISAAVLLCCCTGTASA